MYIFDAGGTTTRKPGNLSPFMSLKYPFSLFKKLDGSSENPCRKIRVRPIGLHFLCRDILRLEMRRDLFLDWRLLIYILKVFIWLKCYQTGFTGKDNMTKVGIVSVYPSSKSLVGRWSIGLHFLYRDIGCFLRTSLSDCSFVWDYCIRVNALPPTCSWLSLIICSTLDKFKYIMINKCH